MKNRKVLESKIIEKVMKDNEFRKRLIENPKNTIEEELGVKLPDNLKFHINEESPDDIHLTLPHENELTQEQLSGITGGWNPLKSGHSHGTPISGQQTD